MRASPISIVNQPNCPRARRAAYPRWAGAILISCVWLTGCASTNDRGLALRDVTVADFVKSPAERSAPSEATTESPVAAAPANATTAAPAPRPAERAPVRPGEQLAKPGDVIVIDGVVGQVSGRPIFASTILDPHAEQLRQEAARLNANEFTMRARQIIFERLREVVLTELFIAEAEATLTPEQQQGLLAFLRMVQEKTIATGQGSRAVTEERLMEELGMTIEQFTERERHTILIQHLIAKKINPRVIVSWRDVQREYERRKDQFNPPAAMTLRILRLSTRDQGELIADIRQQLEKNEPFDAVAARVPDAVTTLDALPMGSGGIHDLPINEAFKPYLEGLAAGDTSRPIESDDRVIWLHVASIDQPRPRSLFDVQRALTRELELRREAEERERYIRSLFARGIHDELDEMARRVLTVALLRYGK